MELLVIALYWRRIVDALINPFIAIVQHIQPENSTSTLGFNHFTLQTNDNSSFMYWEFNTPSTWQLIYHFPTTLMYLYYILLMIPISINVIVSLFYSYTDFEYEVSSFLNRYMLYDKYDRRGPTKFLIFLLITALISFFDGIFLSWATTGKTMVRLPFNWFVFDVLKAFTECFVKSWAVIFFPLALFGLEIFCSVARGTLPMQCLENIYGDGIGRAKLRKHNYDRKIKIFKRLLKKRIIQLNEEQRKEKLKKASAKSKCRKMKTKTVIKKNTAENETGKELFNSKDCVILNFKDGDNPPSYEEESLVPSYEEALTLASNDKN